MMLPRPTMLPLPPLPLVPLLLPCCSRSLLLPPPSAATIARDSLLLCVESPAPPCICRRLPMRRGLKSPESPRERRTSTRADLACAVRYAWGRETEEGGCLDERSDWHRECRGRERERGALAKSESLRRKRWKAGDVCVVSLTASASPRAVHFTRPQPLLSCPLAAPSPGRAAS